jgi:hypothetical protein
MCADVPDVETPDVCQSLIKSVGYKMYFIGERQVRVRPAAAAACIHPRLLTRAQVCSDLGFQQYGHWSLIDSGNPETGVRCGADAAVFTRSPQPLRRVEYGFGPQYSSAVRQSVRRRRSGAQLVRCRSSRSAACRCSTTCIATAARALVTRK